MEDLIDDASPGPGHNFLAGLDPEKLLLAKADDLPALFDLQYATLKQRGVEFLEGITRWFDAHRTGTAVAIAGDEDNDRTSDFIRQIRTFSADNGEADAVRQKVKRPIMDASTTIDSYFNGMRKPLNEAVNRISGLQTVYLREKVARERAAALEAQRRADEEAAAAARRAREAEEERLLTERLAAQSDGVDEAVVHHAQEAALQASESALAAEAKADAVADMAYGPDRNLVRSTSALGTTTTLRDNWTFELVDIKALAAAVAKGEVPAQFLAVNESVVRAAVKGKNGVRTCPGLRIFNDQRAARSGR